MIEYSKQALVIDVAFVHQHFAAQHVVASERIAGELQSAQRKLLSFVNRDQKISDALVGILRIVFERRRDFGRVLDEALLAVVLLEIFIQRFAERFPVRDLALLQAE